MACETRTVSGYPRRMWKAGMRDPLSVSSHMLTSCFRYVGGGGQKAIWLTVLLATLPIFGRSDWAAPPAAWAWRAWHSTCGCTGCTTKPLHAEEALAAIQAGGRRGRTQAARTVVARGRVGRRVGEWQRRVGPGEGDSPQVRVPLGRASGGPGVRQSAPRVAPGGSESPLCRPNRVPTRPQTAPTRPTFVRLGPLFCPTRTLFCPTRALLCICWPFWTSLKHMQLLAPGLGAP